MADLWMFLNGTYIHALSIPINKCTSFSPHPLKWLRFVGYTINGQEGYISLTEHGSPIEDSESDIEPIAYYFVSEAEPRLLDADGINDRTSDASSLSTNREDFRARIIQRDTTCVLTGGDTRLSDACHIIPHAKGDDYMMNFVQHRGANTIMPALDSINDTRNGILLVTLLHRALGLGLVAFLQTPNFALTVDDIYYTQTPQDSPATRLTLHHILDVNNPMVTASTPNNSDARQPEDTSQWPPALVWDYLYGCVAVHAWGMNPFKDLVRRETKSIFYGDESGSRSGDADPHETFIGSQQRVREKAAARNEHSATRDKRRCTDHSEFSDTMDVVMALWMGSPNQRQPSTDRSADIYSQDKVRGWLESV